MIKSPSLKRRWFCKGVIKMNLRETPSPEERIAELEKEIKRLKGAAGLKKSRFSGSHKTFKDTEKTRSGRTARVGRTRPSNPAAPANSLNMPEYAPIKPMAAQTLSSMVLNTARQLYKEVGKAVNKAVIGEENRGATGRNKSVFKTIRTVPFVALEKTQDTYFKPLNSDVRALFMTQEKKNKKDESIDKGFLRSFIRKCTDTDADMLSVKREILNIDEPRRTDILNKLLAALAVKADTDVKEDGGQLTGRIKFLEREFAPLDLSGSREIIEEWNKSMRRQEALKKRGEYLRISSEAEYEKSKSLHYYPDEDVPDADLRMQQFGI